MLGMAKRAYGGRSGIAGQQDAIVPFLHLCLDPTEDPDGNLLRTVCPALFDLPSGERVILGDDGLVSRQHEERLVCCVVSGVCRLRELVFQLVLSLPPAPRPFLLA